MTGVYLLFSTGLHSIPTSNSHATCLSSPISRNSNSERTTRNRARCSVHVSKHNHVSQMWRKAVKWRHGGHVGLWRCRIDRGLQCCQATLTDESDFGETEWIHCRFKFRRILRLVALDNNKCGVDWFMIVVVEFDSIIRVDWVLVV